MLKLPFFRRASAGYLLSAALLATAGAQTQSDSNLTSEVRPYLKVPALYVNGRLTSQILAAPYIAGPADFSDFTAAGISIFNIYLRFDWSGPHEYDFKKIDAKLDLYLKLKPDALFIPRILLTPGDWWCTQFPEDITMRDDGSPAGMFGGRCHPSLASDHYRELSHQAMHAFLDHVEGRYGKSIVGYQVGNGFGGEWLMFNSFWELRPGQKPPTKFGVEDYSPPARRAFRAWLEKKYGTETRLQKAWHDPHVTFATADPPNERERYSTTHGIFFDPAVSERVPDYFTFFNDMVGSVLLENAAWVKEQTHRRKIVGAFYGYLWCNFPNLSVVHTGHLALDRVLASPDIDFIASPYTYDNKQIGGPNNSQTLPAAIQLHGKLYFNEVDTETYLHQRQWRWGNSLRNPTNFAETRALLTRDYAYAFTNGFGMWWTDLFGGTFHSPDIIHLLAQLKDIDNRYLTADHQSNAEIAVVLDTSSFTYFGDGEPLLNALLTAQKQWQFGFIGAPWDAHLLSDMGNPKLHDYKLYIFLNTFHVTPQQREQIHQRLRRNGATALWVYAAGYITDRVSTENIDALTGIHVQETDSAGELHVDVPPSNSPYTAGLSGAIHYGTDVDVAEIRHWYDHQLYLKDPRDPGLQRELPGFAINPRFWVDDPHAQVLGTLAGLNHPGLAVKKVGNWTSLYSSAPIVPAALLRRIARTAGCQIYSDGDDVVYANREFLGIYFPAGGDRTIHLPERSDVMDLMTGKTIAQGATEFPVNVPPNTTLLFKMTRSGNGGNRVP
jgi:Beta-galactosidase